MAAGVQAPGAPLPSPTHRQNSILPCPPTRCPAYRPRHNTPIAPRLLSKPRPAYRVACVVLFALILKPLARTRVLACWVPDPNQATKPGPRLTTPHPCPTCRTPRPRVTPQMTHNQLLRLVVAMESALGDGRYEEAARLRDEFKKLSANAPSEQRRS